jgi:hypothetical protein
MAEATRPPEGSDLVRLCAELNRLAGKYIVIGKDDVTLRTVGGVEIPFANRGLMIRLKQGDREKDRIDLEYLLRRPES